MQCIVHAIMQHANDKKITIAMIPVASMLYIVYNDGIFMLMYTCYYIQESVIPYRSHPLLAFA